MLKLTIEHDFDQLQSKLRGMQENIRSKALASAVNKTVEQAKTSMVREISGEYAVTARYVRDRLSIRRATWRNGSINVSAELAGTDRSRSANVIAFARKVVTLSAARKAQRGGKRAPELQYKFRRSAGFKQIEGSFIGNKGRTVFIRVPGTTMSSRSKYGGTKHAEEIAAVQVIGVPQMFNAKRINKVVEQFMRDKFPEVLERDINFFTGGAFK